MAARKSCTTLTWAEAKNRTGSVGQKKNKEVLRKQNHGQVLANKIIAKSGGDVKDSENRKLKKAYRKQEEKAAAIAAQRTEEREQKRLAAMQEVKPYDRAKERLADMIQELRGSSGDPPKMISVEDMDSEETLAKIAECKQMQLDEIMALEAMIPEEDFVMCHAEKVQELRDLLEDEADDAHDQIARQPPIAFYIRLEVDDYRDSNNDDNEMDLNTMVLIRVTLPPLYLNSEGSQEPIWNFDYVMVTDKNALCSADKPLESLAWLDEIKLKEALAKQAQEDLLPYPCVYELAVTWLSENIYDYLNMQSHLLATK
ncbi:expressed unknown protein [Seminavis robusta]|uniref:Uncharacterized protein n=1 Tax=Seminavis robusta TaxID=568900 RepID=A0A9N8EJQ0_9STRA|nr:expressed unknown protein [Seminavis robusta]|eukprot:Sro1042_g234670.1 n/a (314) ;mRNA; f:12094-13035